MTGVGRTLGNAGGGTRDRRRLWFVTVPLRDLELELVTLRAIVFRNFVHVMAAVAVEFAIVRRVRILCRLAFGLVGELVVRTVAGQAGLGLDRRRGWIFLVARRAHHALADMLLQQQLLRLATSCQDRETRRDQNCDEQISG